MRHPGPAWLPCLLLLTPPFPACAAEDSPTGLYRAAEGPDLASRLWVGTDGRFRYELIAGALDQWARGEWRHLPDGGIALTTRPRPKPPQFRIESMTGGKASGAPLSLHVAWPNGRGIAGIDFRIGLEGGEVVEGYTQEDGWQADSPGTARPLWIELREPIYGTMLARTAIPDGKVELRFVLEPNDMGVADFRDTPAEFVNGRLILHTPDGDIRYDRIEEKAAAHPR